jgi:hypothetical protein
MLALWLNLRETVQVLSPAPLGPEGSGWGLGHQFRWKRAGLRISVSLGRAASFLRVRTSGSKTVDLGKGNLTFFTARHGRPDGNDFAIQSCAVRIGG